MLREKTARRLATVYTAPKKGAVFSPYKMKDKEEEEKQGEGLRRRLRKKRPQPAEMRPQRQVYSVCPDCSFRRAHTQGTPVWRHVCPSCGIHMSDAEK